MKSIFFRLQNILRVPFLKYRRAIQVHLGCGQERIPGFINIDERVTSATDYLVNLNNVTVFGKGNVKCFFSHAFFEHLLRNQRPAHLKKIYEALNSDGFCCYIGIPYFPSIARFYLDGGPGVVGEKFDLFNVYRFTHGDPEQAKGWWFGQLHKSLFDKPEMEELLTKSGFGSFVLFTYCFVASPAHPVNLGFYATKIKRPQNEIQTECRLFIKQVASNKVLLDTINFI